MRLTHQARTRSVRFALTIALLVLGLSGTVLAQGTQTGILQGVITSSDGQPLPGATITVTSPVLQGSRITISETSGAYILRGLPPGDYKVAVSLAGFTTVERSVGVALGGEAVMDASMSVATVEETITVTAEAPSVLTTTQVGANYKYNEIDKLATNRTLQGIAELAPGLTDNTPNANQVTISGAFAFDNVFLLNGVDINDNLFGTANNLFIEDAIQETQVLTSGISAEFGRFSGGVINTVTKRGGNNFSGSFRTDLTNADWISLTPLEERNNQTHLDDITPVYTATLGGPIVKDRLWFFGAARRADVAESRTLVVTQTPYQFREENRRYEGKLTGSLNPNHTLQASYIRNSTSQFDRPSLNVQSAMDPRVLVDRTLPNHLFVANYNGVLTSSLFAEAQYSERKFGFRGTGGTSRDIKDSPFRARGLAGLPAGHHYNAPFFSSFDPEDRNNRQISAALSYFLSTSNLGRHDVKAGFERFTSTRTGGNSQSATGFVFQVDPVVVGGRPARDANGRIIPNFVPGQSRLQNWLSVPGATIDINTLSFYINDRWSLNNHWSFNLGARFETIDTEATGGIVGADTSSLVPRLGATFDVKGDGKYMLYATYAHYAGKASETQFADNTNVGTPSLVTTQYTGPAGQGLDFAPGFDPANYTVLVVGNFPVSNVRFADDLGTPLTREWTLQYGMKLGRNGEAKVIYTNRRVTRFLDDFINISLGRTTVRQDGRTFGPFDNVLIQNTDELKRNYQGLQLQGSYRLTDRWSLAGHYTLQLENDGNFEGEAANQPGNYSFFGDYPEILVQSRTNPDGRLNDFQRHKIRAWTTYNLDLGRAGDVDLSLLYRYNSALTYSLFTGNNVPLSAIQRSRDPGYATPPLTQVLFFGERGEFFFEDSHLFDFAFTYDVPVWGKLRPYVKAEVRNVFNSTPLIGADTTVTAIVNGPVDADGLPTTFNRGPNFGQSTLNPTPTNAGHFPLPREYRFALGFRF